MLLVLLKILTHGEITSIISNLRKDLIEMEKLKKKNDWKVYGVKGFLK
jgi:hypothetical protein